MVDDGAWVRLCPGAPIVIKGGWEQGCANQNDIKICPKYIFRVFWAFKYLLSRKIEEKSMSLAKYPKHQCYEKVKACFYPRIGCFSSRLFDPIDFTKSKTEDEWI